MTRWECQRYRKMNHWALVAIKKSVMSCQLHGSCPCCDTSLHDTKSNLWSSQSNRGCPKQKQVHLTPKRRQLIFSNSRFTYKRITISLYSWSMGRLRGKCNLQDHEWEGLKSERILCNKETVIKEEAVCFPLS